MSGLLYFILLCTNLLISQNIDLSAQNIISGINDVIDQADIPNLHIVLVSENDEIVLISEDGSELKTSSNDSRLSLFELGSTTKAFTAIAVLKLEKENKLDLNSKVSEYLPWFHVNYKDEDHDITLSQLLYHTSGIPWSTISNIPESLDENALEETVKMFSGIELKTKPGTSYEYATINYDILGLIIEKISGIYYEEYMEENVFKPLEMNNTSVGIPKEKSMMTSGHKIGFFSPRKYLAPAYKGNWPAGYIISNAKDMATWLKFQMGVTHHPVLSVLLERSHIRDNSVHPNTNPISSYAAGWSISLTGDNIISHGGLNPNFTSFVGFTPNKKVGVAVLANSNSTYTEAIGNYALKILSGVEQKKLINDVKKDDDIYSILSIVLIVVLLCIIAFLVSIFIDTMKKNRIFNFPDGRKILSIVISILAVIPFLYGVFIIPSALAGFTWKGALVWTPLSFSVAIILVLVTIFAIYSTFILSVFFPSKDKYKRSLPLVILLSLLSGLSNSLVIFIVVNSIYAETNIIYLLYYFALAMVVYIFGRKVVQVKLLELTYGIIYDIRINLIDKVFSTSYQKFQKIDRGQVYATLNHDTNVLGTAANVIVNLITSLITTISVFIYLAFISFWPTVITIGVILLIAVIYYFISQSAEVFYNKARDTHNVYMELLNGMLDGFKELCISRFKKKEYKDEIESTVKSFKDNTIFAEVKFVNALLVGESFLILVLGFVSFGIPKLFPEIQAFLLMSFIMVLLYLIGPINIILQTIPALIQLKISWDRIQSFIKGIPSCDVLINKVITSKSQITVENLQLEGIEFEYEYQGEHDSFGVGPVSFEVNKGEILFIIGGNGSGKTTLANLITGLFKPEKGVIKIDDKEISGVKLGEKYSIVFSDYNLFRKLYNINTDEKDDLIKEYLKKFYLEGKVKIENGEFSTTKLSNGQRKRLALIKCFLENSPIYLFDEVAADQDPDFKKYFYTDLLLQMKKEGKIIIAITHDDHYFHVADKIIKLDRGKIDMVQNHQE